MKQLISLEFIKLKRSPIWLVIFLLPLLSVLWGTAFVLIYRAVPAEVRTNISEEMHLNSSTWDLLFTGSISLFMPLMLPTLIALVMTWLNRAEHQQHLWKRVLSLPIRKRSLFLGKLATGTLLVLGSVAACSVCMLAAGFALGAEGPTPIALLFLKPLLSGLTALPLAVLYLGISMVFSHPAIPVAIGAVLSLPVTMVVNTKKLWLLYPWSYPARFAMGTFIGQENLFAVMMVACVFLVTAFLFLGITVFEKKDIL